MRTGAPRRSSSVRREAGDRRVRSVPWRPSSVRGLHRHAEALGRGELEELVADARAIEERAALARPLRGGAADRGRAAAADAAGDEQRSSRRPRRGGKGWPSGPIRRDRCRPAAARARQVGAAADDLKMKSSSRERPSRRASCDAEGTVEEREVGARGPQHEEVAAFERTARARRGRRTREQEAVAAGGRQLDDLARKTSRSAG
jgi:hypothetical protein